MSATIPLLKSKKRSDLEVDVDVHVVPHFKRYSLLFIIICGVSIVLVAIGLFIAHNMQADVHHGAVSSSSSFAAKVGWDVLLKGGNAIDAIVAMQAVLTVTEPWASGIGGGAFITYYNKKEDKIHILDGREEAPRAIGNIVPDSVGGASVGVPGTVAVMARALRDYGTWDLAQCLSPAINLARNGWILTEFAAERIVEGDSSLRLYNSTKAIYYDNNGQPKKNGTMMYNPDLANTLEILSNKGWESFYTGEIANSIIDAIQNDHINPGVMTLEDLKEYMAVEREPVKGTFNGYEIYGPSMPSSGPTTMFLILNLLEATSLDWKKDGFGSFTSLQIIMNAMSLAYADRSQYMGDGDFIKVPLDGLLEKSYAADRSSLINLTRAIIKASPGYPNGTAQWIFHNSTEDKENLDTTHVSVIDKNYNVVSFTSSIQQTWGNRMVVPGRGFLLNNELTDFSNSGSNAITGMRALRRTALSPDSNTIGGKRPMSSMSPIIVFQDKQPYLALGSPGGSNIICAVLNVLLNIITFNKTLTEALSAPRYISKNDGIWYLDKQFYENQTLSSLFKTLGIMTSPLSEYTSGGVNIVRLSNGKMDAAADLRKRDSAVYYD